MNAQHSHPESYADGVLVVRAESSTWASALRSIAPNLVAELNSQLGDGIVRRIEVRGPTAPSWKHGPRSVRDGRGPRDTYG
jgi:predicted nucleic acid-binding Zn ribbon protein